MLEIKEEDMYASENLFVILGAKKMFYLLGFVALIAASKYTILVYVVCYLLR